LELAKPLVAVAAQQSSDLPSLMAMVYMQAPLGGVFFMHATDLTLVVASLLKRFQLL